MVKTKKKDSEKARGANVEEKEMILRREKQSL